MTGSVIASCIVSIALNGKNRKLDMVRYIYIIYTYTYIVIYIYIIHSYIVSLVAYMYIHV